MEDLDSNFPKLIYYKKKRNHAHNGFSKFIDSASAFVAEMWGLRDGLVLCSNLNIQCLLVEVDSSALVLVLLNPEYVNLVVSPLLDDCRHLLSYFLQVQIKHCFRQANRCADVMARMGSAHCLDVSVFHSPPVDVLEAFEADLNGLFFEIGRASCRERVWR